MTIKTLFDPAKDIYRTIEKVITYNASQEKRLRAEITEYIVTDSIDDQFERLLSKMQMAMDQGEQNEIGVWVSGFYGSGKSSFTKYLGLALDDSVYVDGVRFLKHLQDRLHSPQAKALLGTVATKYPTGVVLLDLASEMLAGATMEDVSTVLYYKVLQWAGYSRNLKVAALERRLKKDGRYQEFVEYIQSEYGVGWKEVQNDALVIDSVIPDVAHAMYPQLFKSATAFSTETEDVVRFENERVQEMIEIAREHTGKQYIIFIIDEVGQYVGSRQNLILNLDGLAKNLKSIGGGKAWIVGTAQQTLTEDDPHTAINSPELYKLKDRFPIQIDLQSSDIREICYRRLLGKSSTGEQTLTRLFDQHGQALRHNTKLQDARFYDANLDRTTFVNLYPFLPAHFDVLLHLLGALAKSTGGIGLRSAIKVIQDILVEGPEGQAPVADQPIGWLATTVTLFDALHQDINRAAPSIYQAVSKALLRFPDSPIHQDVAKTVAVLQILGNMPVTAQNVTSLMHPGVDTPSRRDDVDTAIKELIADSIVPFGEKNGSFAFFSEKLNDIDQERARIPLRTTETRRILNEALREAFTPLPSTRLQGTVVITSGLKAMSSAMVGALAGERETIQTLIEFVEPRDYDAARTHLVDESRQRSAQNTIYLLGRAAPEIDDKVAEIYRCHDIVRCYRNDPDQEVREYCASQTDRATRLTGDLQHLLKSLLGRGSFIFRGQLTAAESLDQDVLEAARKHLSAVAEQVFDRYAEAPARADTALAEKFLRLGNLKAVTAAIDPLGLVQLSGSMPRIKTDHKALVSIRDYIDRNGVAEGKRLIDHFTDAPFGWSQDTLRYLIAALLLAGEIKLRISGREVTTAGQQAIEALRTNNSFKAIGVGLRDTPTDMQALARAAERLTALTGDEVIPLENDISKAAAQHFPQFQLRYGPLASKLETLDLPGADAMSSLTKELTDVLTADASDAPQRLGAEESALYAGLTWASEVDRALKNGLEGAIRDLQEHRREIALLPDTGVPGQLRADLQDELAQIGERLSQDNFYRHAADLNSALTAIKARTRTAAVAMAAEQKITIKEAEQDLAQLPEWSELTLEEQTQTLARLENLETTTSEDLGGLKQLLSQEYVILLRLRAMRTQIDQLGRKRQEERQKAEKDQQKTEREHNIREHRPTLSRTVRVPARIRDAAHLDILIGQLQGLKGELTAYTNLDVTISLED